MIGLLLIILAEFLWATEFVLIRRFFNHHNIFFIMALASIFGSLFFLPSLFVIKQKLNFSEIGLVLLYGITSWYLAQSVYAKGIQMSSNTFAATLVTLTLPLFTLILSYIFLKESVTPRILIGGVFMVMGFLLISTK